MSMLSHLSLGVSDLPRARRFYDGVMAPLGVECLWDHPRALGYGPPGGNDKLALFAQPEGSRPLAAGPGFHLALAAPSREAVDACHATALALGGACAGPPGPRPQYSPTYYAAFFLDPDGHKLEIVFQ